MSPVPEPRALAIDALSQDWQGKSMYMFTPLLVLNSHSEAQDHPDGRGDTHRPLVAITTVVSTPATIEFGSSAAETFCHNRAISQAASHTICTHGASYAALPSSMIFKGGL